MDPTLVIPASGGDPIKSNLGRVEIAWCCSDFCAFWSNVPLLVAWVPAFARMTAEGDVSDAIMLRLSVGNHSETLAPQAHLKGD
jgi:hypothetical protein